MGNKSAALVALVFTFVVAACGGSGDSGQSTTGPSPVPTAGSPTPTTPRAGCATTVTGLPSSVPYQGGRYQFTIGLPAGCTWTARADQSWADVAPANGDGSATPVLTVNENTRTDSRTVTVTINGQSFRAVQNAPACSYTVDPTSLDESGGGGLARIVLTTGAGCSWTATASEAWIRVLTASGVGSATIQMELAPNTSDVRHAFVTIAGQRVNVTQRRQQ